MRLSLLGEGRDEPSLNATLEDVKLTQSLLLITLICENNSEAVGQNSDRVANTSERLFDQSAVLVECLKFKLCLVGEVTVHNEV